MTRGLVSPLTFGPALCLGLAWFASACAPEPPQAKPTPAEEVRDDEPVAAEPEDAPAEAEAPVVAPKPRPGPNVILLVMDTVRADRCSVHGYERPTTPYLEEFAEDAVVFDQAWSPAPWTAPSHASLFTGLLPARHGLRAGVSRHLSDARETLAETLREAGWATAGFSNAPPVSRAYGFDQGFELFREMFSDPGWTHPPARRTHQFAAEWAEAMDAEGRAFFLFVNDFDAHLPYRPVDELRERFVQGDVSVDRQLEAMQFGFGHALEYNLRLVPHDEGQDALLSDLYDGSIATLDAEIRTLFERLDAKGLLRDSVVVIVGDHGDNLGEYGLHDHQFSVHRGLLHVPLIVRAPEHFVGGRRSTDVVRLEDLHPTLLELVGLPVPSNLDGVSILADTQGRVARGALGEPKVLIEHAGRMFPGADFAPFRRSLRSVFDGRHQLILGSDGSRVLYDLGPDGDAFHDLSGDLPDVVERLRNLDGS